jgi:hypothetical protein
VFDQSRKKLARLVKPIFDAGVAEFGNPLVSGGEEARISGASSFWRG